MEKPSGLIDKVIDTLQLVNNIQGPYSLIEKDIILQHIRAAYLQLLNHPALEEVDRNSVVLPSLETDFNAKEESYIQQINELNLCITQIEKELQNSKSELDTLKPIIESKQKEKSDYDQQISDLNNIIEVQKGEIASLLKDLDIKDSEIKEISNGFKQEIENQTKTIEKLTNELELVLLREEQIDPSELNEAVETPLQEPITEPEVKEFIPVPEPLNHSETRQEPAFEAVDDILEFIHPNIAKQEPVTKTAVPQPLLFVEENDSPKIEKRSLNDLLTEKKEDNSIGSRFQQAKIQDLTKAISINDKFLFIRELFKSKGEEFSASLHRLNNCANIEEAFNVMEELKNFYFWDTTSSAYLSLCDLVRRKFL